MFKKLTDFWSSIDWASIPDCPSCKGTGEATDLEVFVYWKGKERKVCYQCKGSGKV